MNTSLPTSSETRTGTVNGALPRFGASEQIRVEVPSRRLSILHIVLSAGATNGTYNQHCLPLRNERDISICTYFPSAIKPPSEIKLYEGASSFSAFVRAFRSALAKGRYDIVHMHEPHTAILFLAASLLSRGKYLGRTVFTMHNSYASYKFRNKLMLVAAFAFPRRVVCCGDASRDSLPRHLRWLAAGRLASVQNCLDIERVDAVLQGYPRPANRVGFTIASVGRLIEIKNPLALLAAFSRSAPGDSRLVFIGAGPLRDALVVKSEALGLAKDVEFTGLVPRDDVYRRLAQADVFVSASRGEGLPVAVIEAMACGCPVILSDIPPHREIAAGREFVPLVPPDDITTLAEQINRFRQMSRPQREGIGQQCRELVQSRFNLQLMHKRYADIYAGLIPRHEMPRFMPCKSN